ncbi:hypothetical protein [Enhygromyxa salina]|nr:hypothetical protein [Enhygromyxa salina]
MARSFAPDLCIATGVDTGNGRGGCVYAGPNAPVFDGEVCWNGDVATVKGTAPCVDGSRVYFLRNGEVVDPDLNIVAAYAVVPDACKFMSCVPSSFESQGLPDDLACCGDNGCVPSVGGSCPEGEPTWCTQLEKTDDGLICHQD